MIARGFQIALATVLLSMGCSTLGGRYWVPLVHPEKLKANPDCGECHGEKRVGAPYALFSHTVTFARVGHRDVARQEPAVCAMCHRTDFCNDCHVTRSELKPSDRRFTEAGRVMPHRGDYRSRHQIDGRLDPVSCAPCHANPKAAKTCAPCHGR